MKRLAAYLAILICCGAWPSANLSGGIPAAAGGGSGILYGCYWTGTSDNTSSMDYDSGGTDLETESCGLPAQGDQVLVFVSVDNASAIGNISCTDAANSASFTDGSVVGNGTRSGEVAGYTGYYTMGSTAATTFSCSWVNTQSADWTVVIVVLSDDYAEGLGSSWLASFGCPDPYSVDPLTSSGDSLVFAYGSLDQAGSKTVTDVPTNYTVLIDNLNNGSTSFGLAHRTVNAAAEDPGVFTCSSNDGYLAKSWEWYVP